MAAFKKTKISSSPHRDTPERQSDQESIYRTPQGVYSSELDQTSPVSSEEPKVSHPVIDALPLSSYRDGEQEERVSPVRIPQPTL